MPTFWTKLKKEREFRKKYDQVKKDEKFINELMDNHINEGGKIKESEEADHIREEEKRERENTEKYEKKPGFWSRLKYNFGKIKENWSERKSRKLDAQMENTKKYEELMQKFRNGPVADEEKFKELKEAERRREEEKRERESTKKYEKKYGFRSWLIDNIWKIRTKWREIKVRMHKPQEKKYEKLMNEILNDEIRRNEEGKAKVEENEQEARYEKENSKEKSDNVIESFGFTINSNEDKLNQQIFDKEQKEVKKEIKFEQLNLKNKEEKKKVDYHKLRMNNSGEKLSVEDQKSFEGREIS
ncbi:hypothetical protein SAMN05216390_11437 [Lachnospiraceae bacterium KH1T2]|nr:hypothetical protein SAMN05216390_11437 [Lachnospiraceae bacterium KH1T2]